GGRRRCCTSWGGCPQAGGGGARPQSPHTVAVAAGGRMRDRRSGVALPGPAGAPADSEAGLLEAARATPRRSSIIKVSEATSPQSVHGNDVGYGLWQGVLRPVATQARHCFLPPPSLPNLPS
uniref:Uncharacterized protein n=1 Tax=Spermophilus dauricus TaxID=99837 RepID=A0A8C9PN62_SPEDA